MKVKQAQSLQHLNLEKLYIPPTPPAQACAVIPSWGIPPETAWGWVSRSGEGMEALGHVGKNNWGSLSRGYHANWKLLAVPIQLSSSSFIFQMGSVRPWEARPQPTKVTTDRARTRWQTLQFPKLTIPEHNTQWEEGGEKKDHSPMMVVNYWAERKDLIVWHKSKHSWRSLQMMSTDFTECLLFCNSSCW